MQERFNEQSAVRAITLYKSFIENLELKNAINNSNKILVILSVIAYFNECSKILLKRAIPVQIDDTLEKLVKLGYLTKYRDNSEIIYKLADLECFKQASYEYDYNTAYLFANALMNIGVYIKKYDIKSWNFIALMLEIALKHDFNKKSTVHLDEKTIQSITGGNSNKLNARKAIEKMGIIRGAKTKGGYSYGGDYKINKNAFVISYN